GRVGLESLPVGLERGLRDRHAAGVGVLDDDAGGSVEAARAFPGGVGVGDVVVRQLLALQLAVIAQQAGGPVAVYIEGGFLVRVLAVAQGLRLVHLQRQRAGPVVAGGRGVLRRGRLGQAGQVAGDRAVVGGGVGVGLGGQLQPQRI